MANLARLLGLTLAVAVATLLPTHAAGAGDATCVLALSKTDPATVNVAFPDEAADYYTVPFAAVPGLRLRITGSYPHARYVSFNVYDPALRPFAAASDVELRPDPGSSNPFRPGARRDVADRSYTAFVEFAEKPATPRSNTIYAGSGAPGWLIYRIYVRDRGSSPTGGVPLPTVTVERSTNGEAPARSACDTVTKPSTTAANDLVAANGGVGPLDPLQPWGRPRPMWVRFVNLPTSLADFSLNNPTGEDVRPAVDPLVAQGGQGGFLSNLHNAYLTTAVNRAYGRVVVTRFKAPTFPDTRLGARRMPGGVQVRYWSVCHNEFFTQRYIACRTDDQVALDANGFATVVISTPEDRPATARRRCGVTWLPWGPDAEGVVLYRHMLPAASFGQAIQNTTYRDEASTMGRYLPRSRYYPDAAAFDKERKPRC